MNIKLTSYGGRLGLGKPRKVLINWDNVDFVIESTSHYGEQYTEVHCSDHSIDVEETLRKIENAIK